MKANRNFSSKSQRTLSVGQRINVANPKSLLHGESGTVCAIDRGSAMPDYSDRLIKVAVSYRVDLDDFGTHDAEGFPYAYLKSDLVAYDGNKPSRWKRCAWAPKLVTA